jgi:hypothetical protein
MAVEGRGHELRAGPWSWSGGGVGAGRGPRGRGEVLVRKATFQTSAPPQQQRAGPQGLGLGRLVRTYRALAGRSPA